MVVASVGGELGRALSFAFGMFWQILWALILGFALSGAVQALVSKEEMRRLLPLFDADVGGKPGRPHTRFGKLRIFSSRATPSSNVLIDKVLGGV